MTATRGSAALASNTARLADKEATEDKALRRLAINGVVELSGVRRSQAREMVGAFLASGESLTNLEAWLRANYRIDPTGVTAVRNVMRGGRRG